MPSNLHLTVQLLTLLVHARMCCLAASREEVAGCSQSGQVAHEPSSTVWDSTGTSMLNMFIHVTNYSETRSGEVRRSLQSLLSRRAFDMCSTCHPLHRAPGDSPLSKRRDNGSLEDQRGTTVSLLARELTLRLGSD